MLTPELIGRRVRVLAWYDHASLVAARRRPAASSEAPEGTITRVEDRTGRVWVRVDDQSPDVVLAWGDVDVLFL